MIIWAIGIVLVALAAVIGYFMGAVRSAISLVGVVVAAFMAKTVGGWLSGLVPTLGFRNPVWEYYIPPLLGFLVVSIVFLVIALTVHHLYHKHYRNRADEYTYARWFRLNQRTGAAIGAVIGTVWLILLAVVMYVPAYLSTQLADAEEESFSLRMANSFAHGMEDTGLLRIVERFQPASEEHYLASDILGLVYNNPSLHSRLASYPPFLGLAEMPEIAELGRDPEINNLIQQRAGIATVIEHPRIRAVVDNHELVKQLLATDLRDLDGYLRTGVSEKYKGETILGRWRLNVRRSISQMKMVDSDTLPRIEFNILRRALNVYVDNMTIGFTTDNRALLKVKATDEHKLFQVVGRRSTTTSAAPVDPNDPNAPAPAVGSGSAFTPSSLAARALPQQPEGGMDASMRARYGLGQSSGGAGLGAAGARPLAGSAPAVAVPRAPARSSATTILSPLMSSGEGTWARSGDGDYRVTFSADGKELVLDVRVRENQLIASVDGRTLVFDRI